jgi:hypothetical protein
MPVRLVCGLSRTRKAARLAVYDATMIMAKPAHTMPSTRAEKLRGVPSPAKVQEYIITINVLLILKVRDIIFFSRAKHINAPLYVLPQAKKIISRTFKIRGALVFLFPKE